MKSGFLENAGSPPFGIATATLVSPHGDMSTCPRGHVHATVVAGFNPDVVPDGWMEWGRVRSAGLQ